VQLLEKFEDNGFYLGKVVDDLIILFYTLKLERRIFQWVTCIDRDLFFYKRSLHV
jgi:hypothetical protein